MVGWTVVHFENKLAKFSGYVSTLTESKKNSKMENSLLDSFINSYNWQLKFLRTTRTRTKSTSGFAYSCFFATIATIGYIIIGSLISKDPEIVNSRKFLAIYLAITWVTGGSILFLTIRDTVYVHTTRFMVLRTIGVFSVVLAIIFIVLAYYKPINVGALSNNFLSKFLPIVIPLLPMAIYFFRFVFLEVYSFVVLQYERVFKGVYWIERSLRDQTTKLLVDLNTDLEEFVKNGDK